MNDELGPFSLILLAMPGLAMLVVARTLFPARNGRGPEMQQMLRMIGVLLLQLALAGAAIGVFGFLAFPAIPVIAMIVLMMADRYRRGEHQALLFTLAAGARRGVPLNQSARAFAEENGGDAGTRALALAEYLEQGMSLREAAKHARLKLSLAMLLAVRLGEMLGDLGHTLFRSLDDTVEIETALRGAMAQVFYLIALLSVGGTLLLFLMLKIVPVFDRMFEEFGLKLPAITVLLIEVSRWGGKIAAPLVGLGLMVGPAVMLIGALSFVGWLPINFPGAGWVMRRYDNSLVLRGLSLCVQRQLSLSDGLGLLSHQFPRSGTANRLRLAWLAVQHGVDWRFAMQKAGLLNYAEASVLAAAERSGNLTWALDEMADSSLRRYILWLQLRYQIAFPLVLLLLGGFVGYVIVALFLPLVSLIQGLS